MDYAIYDAAMIAESTPRSIITFMSAAPFRVIAEPGEVSDCIILENITLPKFRSYETKQPVERNCYIKTPTLRGSLVSTTFSTTIWTTADTRTRLSEPFPRIKNNIYIYL